jgi:hypothetical protein
MVTTPMIGALSNHNERTHAKRMVTGIILRISETAFLILYGRSIGTATNALGNILVFVNAVSYGFY